MVATKRQFKEIVVNASKKADTLDFDALLFNKNKREAKALTKQWLEHYPAVKDSDNECLPTLPVLKSLKMLELPLPESGYLNPNIFSENLQRKLRLSGRAVRMIEPPPLFDRLVD